MGRPFFLQPGRELVLVVIPIAAMGRDLPADFTAAVSRSVHVRMGGPGAERAEEAGEVMLVDLPGTSRSP